MFSHRTISPTYTMYNNSQNITDEYTLNIVLDNSYSLSRKYNIMCENVNIFQYHSSIYFTAFMLFVAVYIQLYFSGNFKGWRQKIQIKIFS